MHVWARTHLSLSSLAALTIAALLAAPAHAQVPSMLSAPGLLPVTPDAAMPAVAAPPELTAPPADGGLSNCDASMLKHQQRRNAAIAQINSMVQGGKGKKLDPAAACPRFRNLVAAENEMRNWMIKNKDWCSIPDQVMDDMKKGFSRTPTIAGQACNAAAQVARMRQQQRQQQSQQAGAATAAAPAVKLPSGPL